MKHAVISVTILLVLIIAGCSGEQPEKPQIVPSPQPSQVQETAPADSAGEPVPLPEAAEPVQAPEIPSWKSGSVAIAGTYADAEIVELGDGTYRMYYAAEPEIPGFNGQVYSATSTDGIKWITERGERMTGAIFPSVIKLGDGTYRMYYQSRQVIKSAVSKDGLAWKQEAGTRMGTQNAAGLALTGVGAPTVIRAGNEYVMVYSGAINEAYPEKVPNPDTHLFLWATSADGITFESKGMALDSRNGEFKGWLDGPEFTQWDSELRLYFWGYKGIYHVTFDGSSFSQQPAFDFTTSSDPMIQFPQDPPGDPTLANIAGTWMMYYGQHEKGIYYATLK